MRNTPVHGEDGMRLSPGFVGVKCEVNLNECQTNPCKNGGVCVDGVANYTCDCTHTGYMGNNCELNINECLTSPCLNRGTCFDTYGSYLCQCAAGFDGPNCQFVSITYFKFIFFCVNDTSAAFKKIEFVDYVVLRLLRLISESCQYLKTIHCIFDCLKSRKKCLNKMWKVSFLWDNFGK